MTTGILEESAKTVIPDIALEPWAIQLPRLPGQTDEWFAEVALRNRDYRLERNAKGDLEFMSPTGGKTGARNSELAIQFGNWAKMNGTGQAFDSSTGYHLPNNSIRSPDVSWVRRSKLEALSDEQLEGYLPTAPDFVVELRSPSDSLRGLQAKMAEYMENGTELGWLIDPMHRTIYVYRSGAEVEQFTDLGSISGAPTLPTFELNLLEIW